MDISQLNTHARSFAPNCYVQTLFDPVQTHAIYGVQRGREMRLSDNNILDLAPPFEILEVAESWLPENNETIKKYNMATKVSPLSLKMSFGPPDGKG